MSPRENKFSVYNFTNVIKNNDHCLNIKPYLSCFLFGRGLPPTGSLVIPTLITVMKFCERCHFSDPGRIQEKNLCEQVRNKFIENTWENNDQILTNWLKFCQCFKIQTDAAWITYFGKVFSRPIEGEHSTMIRIGRALLALFLLDLPSYRVFQKYQNNTTIIIYLIKIWKDQ